jgi:hypothetical protein
MSLTPTNSRRVALSSGKITDPNMRSCKKLMICGVPPVLRTNQNAAIDDSFFLIKMLWRNSFTTNPYRMAFSRRKISDAGMPVISTATFGVYRV